MAKNGKNGKHFSVGTGLKAKQTMPMQIKDSTISSHALKVLKASTKRATLISHQ